MLIPSSPASLNFCNARWERQVEIEAVGGAGLWQIEVDANQLESALVNLAINARDAMPNGGKLTIEAANVHVDDRICSFQSGNDAGSICRYLRDRYRNRNESGYAEPRVRAVLHNQGTGQGTGLGLSQVYGFVKQSGGHVKIYSELGQGTTIKIYLPRYSAKSPE